MKYSPHNWVVVHPRITLKNVFPIFKMVGFPGPSWKTVGIPSLPKSSKQPRGTSFLNPPGSVSWQLGFYSLHSLNYPKSNSLPLKNDGWKTNQKIFSFLEILFSEATCENPFQKRETEGTKIDTTKLKSRLEILQYISTCTRFTWKCPMLILFTWKGSDFPMEKIMRLLHIIL